MTKDSKHSRTALACAVDLLARREHFAAELRRKLRLRYYEHAEIEEALTHLQERGYQCESRSTESYVRMRIEKGFGPLKIASELNTRGASSELVFQYLPSDADYWTDVLRGVCQKRFAVSEGELTPKQLRFLLARGFGWDHIRAVFAVVFPG